MWTDAGSASFVMSNLCPRRKMPKHTGRHTMGNSLFRNRGDGTFEDVTAREQALRALGMGRRGTRSRQRRATRDFVTCGMLTNQSNAD